MTTVSGKNIKEIPNIIDTIVDYKVDVYAFARYCPTSEEKDIGITSNEYRDLLDICFQKFTRYKKEGFQTYFNLKDHLWTLYKYEEVV